MEGGHQLQDCEGDGSDGERDTGEGNEGSASSSYSSTTSQQQGTATDGAGVGFEASRDQLRKPEVEEEVEDGKLQEEEEEEGSLAGTSARMSAGGSEHSDGTDQGEAQPVHVGGELLASAPLEGLADDGGGKSSRSGSSQGRFTDEFDEDEGGSEGEDSGIPAAPRPHATLLRAAEELLSQADHPLPVLTVVVSIAVPCARWL